jgi:endonuclease/exonuclease/phosphatase family metal-dependent hydrolase
MKVFRRSATAILMLFLFVSCAPTSRASDPDTRPLRIASFNLEVYGPTKAGNQALLGVYARIIRHFDIVAVQEIRDASGTALPALLAAVNADGHHFDTLVGPRLGRTSSKEQYAFIFNTQRVELLPGSCTYDDDGDGNGVNDVDDATLHPGTDLFEREPLVARFKVTSGSFDFDLIDIHTKPEDATAEIGYLPEVMADAVSRLGEKDVICLGDYNADGTYFDEGTYASIFPSSTYDWLIANSVDTTEATSSNTYDRIVTTKSVEEDFDGVSGVYRYDQAGDLGDSGLTADQVSDHCPVYAEFAVGKAPD